MNRRIAAITLSLLGVAVFYGVAALWVSAPGTIARNTSVLGVEVGGLSTDEAAAVVAQEVEKRTQRAITIAIDDISLQVTPADAGLGVDVPASVSAAVGRLWAPQEILPRLLGTVDLEPVISVNPGALDAVVESLALDVDDPAREPSITYRDGEPVLRAGESGLVLDRGLMRDRLTEQFLTAERIAVSRSPQEPSVSAAEAQRVVGTDATAAVAHPITVLAQDGQRNAQAVLSPVEIAAALRFTAADGSLVPVLDAEILRQGIASELAGFEQPGRNAGFRIINDAPVVVPSITGLGVNPEELVRSVAAVLTNAAPRQVQMGVGPIPPTLTTEQAQALGVTEKLSTFTQRYPFAPYRVTNIGQAADYINGTLVMPGETYSHNDTLRERTEANGYTEGYIIGPGGIFRKELGGGVSASATAMWTAAFFAGMEPVQVRAHSIWIPRYQPGLEATISWGNFDLKWRNPASTAVFITASTTSTSITITLWGTRQFDDIDAVSGPKRDIRAFTTVVSDDPECEPQEGQSGFRITVERVFRRAGLEVKRDSFNTTYRPSPTVRCSATSAQPSPTPTRTPRPTPTASPTVTPTAVATSPAAEPTGSPTTSP